MPQPTELDPLTRAAYQKLYESKFAEFKNRLRAAGEHGNTHNQTDRLLTEAINVLYDVNELCVRLGIARIGPARLYLEPSPSV